MNLSWKFWKRKKRQPLHVVPVADPAPQQPVFDTWSPLASNKELLGLQRVIGNQAVLELLAVRNQQGSRLANKRL